MVVGDNAQELGSLRSARVKTLFLLSRGLLEAYVSIHTR